MTTKLRDEHSGEWVSCKRGKAPWRSEGQGPGRMIICMLNQQNEEEDSVLERGYQELNSSR